MSVDISGEDKQLLYVNLRAVGKESLNEQQNYATATMTFRNAPLVQNQSQYLVCATRWRCQCSEIPSIEPTTLEVYGYTDAVVATGDPLAEYTPPTTDAEFTALEQDWEANHTQLYPRFNHFAKIKRFEIPAAYTAYEWFNRVRNMLHELLPGVTAANTEATNTFLRYSDRIKIVLLPDMRVQIWVSDSHKAGAGLTINYTPKIYLKASPGLFDILQFQMSQTTDFHNNFVGRRFFAAGGDVRSTDIVWNGTQIARQFQFAEIYWGPRLDLDFRLHPRRQQAQLLKYHAR